MIYTLEVTLTPRQEAKLNAVMVAYNQQSGPPVTPVANLQAFLSRILDTNIAGLLTQHDGAEAVQIANSFREADDATREEIKTKLGLTRA